MLKILSKYEQRFFTVPNSFPLPISPVLLLDDFAGRIARELWWMNQEFSPVDIISPWFAMLIYITSQMNNMPVGGHSSET
jgi:hypothetical protein